MQRNINWSLLKKYYEVQQNHESESNFFYLAIPTRHKKESEKSVTFGEPYRIFAVEIPTYNGEFSPINLSGTPVNKDNITYHRAKIGTENQIWLDEITDDHQTINRINKLLFDPKRLFLNIKDEVNIPKAVVTEEQARAILYNCIN